MTVQAGDGVDERAVLRTRGVAFDVEVGKRSAFVMRRPARASATRAGSDGDVGVVRERFVDQLVRASSRAKIVHHGSGSCTVCFCLCGQRRRQRQLRLLRIDARNEATAQYQRCKRQRQQVVSILGNPLSHWRSTHFGDRVLLAACARKPAIQRKNSGTKNVAMNVAASMPPMTLVPSE